MECAICHARRPRRYCPGVHGTICSPCCGAGREITVDCPLDCVFLQEAHRHEKLPARDPNGWPNRDIKVGEALVRTHHQLLGFLSLTLLRTAREVPGVADRDALEALDGLIRTWRTLAGGIYYESRPVNPLAASVYDAIQGAVSQFREAEHQQLGMTRTRDADVVGLLVLLQHFALSHDNGRPKGRAFLDTLREFQPPEPSASSPSSAILL